MSIIDTFFKYLQATGMDRVLIVICMLSLPLRMLADHSRDAKERRLLDENETLHRQLDELEGHR